MPESPLNPECGGGGWVTHALTKVFFHYLFSSWVFWLKGQTQVAVLRNCLQGASSIDGNLDATITGCQMKAQRRKTWGLERAFRCILHGKGDWTVVAWRQIVANCIFQRNPPQEISLSHAFLHVLNWHSSHQVMGSTSLALEPGLSFVHRAKKDAMWLPRLGYKRATPVHFISLGY